MQFIRKSPNDLEKVARVLDGDKNFVASLAVIWEKKPYTTPLPSGVFRSVWSLQQHNTLFHDPSQFSDRIQKQGLCYAQKSQERNSGEISRRHRRKMCGKFGENICRFASFSFHEKWPQEIHLASACPPLVLTPW